MRTNNQGIESFLASLVGSDPRGAAGAIVVGVSLDRDAHMHVALVQAVLILDADDDAGVEEARARASQLPVGGNGQLDRRVR